MTADRAFALVQDELENALHGYDSLHSLHEAYAVLLEEVEELWDEIKAKPENLDITRVRREATQVAAMALRLLVDCV